MAETVNEKQTTGVYQDLGVLGREMASLKEMGDPAKLDETNELIILRAFASKLLKVLGAEMDRKSFIAYLTREKGMDYGGACGTWERFEHSGFLEQINGYVQHEFVDKNTSSQLVKVLGEIRGIIKQIEEGNRKDAKHVKMEDIGEFVLKVNQHVEKLLLKVGGKQDAVHDWRKWFSSELEEFKSRNAKGG